MLTLVTELVADDTVEERESPVDARINICRVPMATDTDMELSGSQVEIMK